MAHATLLVLALAAFRQIRAVLITFPRQNISSSSQGSSSAPLTCDDINHCRTLWGIINSCVVTISACTYLALHPNVPDPKHTQWRMRAIRVCSAIIAFFVPELILLGAASQWWAVWKDKTSFQGWTRRHSYFTVMGGFCKSGEQLRDLSSLDADLYPELLKREDPARDPDESSLHPTEAEEPDPPKYRILVTESEILDKSKSDPLGKLFTILQITWFIAQYLERWVAHQPRTQLEVLTLAYAVLNISVYALWWDKPLNVQEAIDVGGRASAVGRTEGGGDRIERKDAIVDIILDAVRSIIDLGEVNFLSRVTVLPAAGAVLFNAVHFFAWSFPFPTVLEKWLWRSCAIYCTVAPFVVAAAGPILYPICRITLVVLTFTSLRTPPAGVFEATSWASFLPHFG